MSALPAGKSGCAHRLKNERARVRAGCAMRLNDNRAVEPFSRLSGGAHARRLDEALGGIVDAASGAASGRMNIELGGFRVPSIRRRAWRQRQFVMNRLGMIRQHLLDIIDLAVIHDATDKVGPRADEIARE